MALAADASQRTAVISSNLTQAQNQTITLNLHHTIYDLSPTTTLSQYFAECVYESSYVNLLRKYLFLSCT